MRTLVGSPVAEAQVVGELDLMPGRAAVMMEVQLLIPTIAARTTGRVRMVAAMEEEEIEHHYAHGAQQARRRATPVEPLGSIRTSLFRRA